MKRTLFFLIALAAALPIDAQRMNRAKLSDLKISVKQLMRNPIKNENQIRMILSQIEPEDKAWVSAKLDELDSALVTKRLPKVLPGVPTPAEYMPTKKEPELATTSEEEYEKAPTYEATAPAVVIPQEEAPAYEEHGYYDLPPAMEMPAAHEAPAYNPPAYEASSKHRVKSERKMSHHNKHQTKKTHLS